MGEACNFKYYLKLQASPIITTLTVYVSACDLEKKSVFEKSKVEIASHVRFSIHVNIS